jgi:hypothetical protein
MAFEDEPLERAYPYRTGWRVMCCVVIVLGALGFAGLALVPLGGEKVRDGNLPVGIALVVIGLFGAPLILLAAAALVTGVRESIKPPLVRVTTTALILPPNLRENSTIEEQDERGEPKDPNAPPAHPEEIPFSAIRWVRREGPPNPGSDKIMIVHDLSGQTLVIEQHMMSTGDFNELETVLRAAVPHAFTSAPPPNPAGRTEGTSPAPPAPPE